ncbi:hypothetical protein [Aliikangiella sp. IMCC44359]|uniref:hypothetical protein n=1 Tax=Aliikangiella sp. IMCC44359 TaxID=3459125 RepID=UPI00403AC07E
MRRPPRIPPTKEAIEILFDIYDSCDSETKVEILGSISKPEPFYKEAFALIKKGMNDKDYVPRANAVDSLRCIVLNYEPRLSLYDEELIQLLLLLKSDKSERIQESCNDILKCCK